LKKLKKLKKTKKSLGEERSKFRIPKKLKSEIIDDKSVLMKKISENLLSINLL